METWKARLAKGMTKLRKPRGVVSEEESSRDESTSSTRSNGGDDNNTNAKGMEINPRCSDGDGVGDHPPVDDCCPICFGSFTIPCKSNCSHWYCGTCILQYWNYSAASKPCKCPMCASSITKLTPEASLYCPQQQDREVSKVLQNVDRYNRLFVGGALGLVQRVRESPLFIKRIFQHMMDPDSPYTYLHEMRLFAMMLSIVYAASPFNFIPTGGLGIVRLFDYIAMVLVLVLQVVGIFRRRRLARRVREFPFDE